MQWDDGVNAGFSSAAKEKLYICQDESADRPTVQNQQAREDSLYHEVKKLIAIRQAHPALLSRGEIAFVYARENAYPFAYLRSAGEGKDGEKILVVLNPSDREESFPCDLKTGEVIYRFGGELKTQDGQMTIPACSAVWVKVE